MRPLITRSLLAGVALVMLAACGATSGGSAKPSSTAALPPTSGPTTDVEMQDYAFAPGNLEIEAGTTVRWTNRGQAPHTATAADGSFDTGQIAAGDSASQVFVTAGSFPFVCSLHHDMRGTITVVPSSTAAPPPSPMASTDPLPTQATRFHVPLHVATAHTVTADVVDWTGLVTEAMSGDPGDGASVPSDTVAVANDGPTTLVVTWVGGPCDRENTVVFDAKRATITVVQAPCEGDAIGFDRIVRLELAAPLDASSITGVLQPGGDSPG